jgi:uncharacterized membrane protein
MIFLVCYILGWIAGVVALSTDNTPKDIHTVAQTLLLYQLTVSVGLMGLISAYGHLFRSDKIAKQIGWQTGSLFQIELGYCCLGMGLMGMFSFVFRDNFWLATIIFTSSFLLGAALVHIKEMKRHKNFNLGNSVSAIPDILIPMPLIVLWFLAQKG